MAPSWIRDGVIYEIFVDRFARSDRMASSDAFEPWGAVPSATGFMGGNLPGIGERLGYLEDIGVNVLYLTPICLSTANHRYHTCDYFRIDPRIGTLRDFRRLIAAAHRRGMRVILDGVFNHCGRGFFPFVDVLENGRASAWASWFHVAGFPVDAYGKSRARGWLGAPEVPEINLANPAAREYMLRVAEFWTRQGIDGWRFDAVAHVQHRDFWREMCDAVRRVNADCYLLAEIWEDPTPWLIAANFDGATNYQLRDCLIEFVVRGTITASQFARALDGLLQRHPHAVAQGMCNLLGSHDTQRIWRVAAGRLDRLKMAFAMLFVLPGVPSVYYGDEIGVDGGGDPENRGCFPWDRSEWNVDVLSTVKTWIRLRRGSEALRAGTWETAAVDDERDLCVFVRRSASEECVVIVHRGRSEVALACTLPGNVQAVTFMDPLTGTSWRVDDGRLRLDVQPYSVTLLMRTADSQQARRPAWPTGERHVEQSDAVLEQSKA